jgi:hypothetical protein
VAVFGGGLDVAAEFGEVLGAGEGAHCAADFLPDFCHPDVLFCSVVGEWHLGVAGEGEVVGESPGDAAGQGAVFAAECAVGVGGGGDGVLILLL